MAEWHRELVTDDLLDGLPPAALATVRQVAGELTDVRGERVVIIQVNWID